MDGCLICFARPMTVWMILGLLTAMSVVSLGLLFSHRNLDRYRGMF